MLQGVILEECITDNIHEQAKYSGRMYGKPARTDLYFPLIVWINLLILFPWSPDGVWFNVIPSRSMSDFLALITVSLSETKVLIVCPSRANLPMIT